MPLPFRTGDNGLNPEPLIHSTLKGSTEARLRKSLLNGEMRPGEIYSANSMANVMGVSNSPIREAMMSLANKGLLELVRNRGFRVIELTEQDKREVYELRLLVEVEAVRRAALSGIGPNEAEELTRLAQKTLDLAANAGNDLVDYLDTDHRFHMALVAQQDNKRWSTIVEELRDLSRVNGYYEFLAEERRLCHSAEEHLRITEAVINREPDRAAALMIQHLDYARPGRAQRTD